LHACLNFEFGARHLRDKKWRRQQRAGHRVEVPGPEQRRGGASGAGAGEGASEAGAVLLAPAGPLQLRRRDDDSAVAPPRADGRRAGAAGVAMTVGRARWRRA
jgi:hypothetical protein